MADTATMNNGGFYSTHKRKRDESVAGVNLTTNFVDLTGSPSPSRTPKARKLSRTASGAVGSPSPPRPAFRINPIKTEARPSVTREPGNFPASSRHEFRIRPIQHEPEQNPTRVRSGPGASVEHVLISSSPTPKHRHVEQRDCAICVDTFDIDVLPLRPHATAAADHAICYGCWEKHLHSELERKDWNQLSCPDCGETMSVADICQLDIFFQERIEPKIMDKAAKACLDQDAEWVSCPSGTCKSGALMTEGHIFTCQECHFRYCFSCMVPMHEGETCSEYHERFRREPEKQREEELSTKTVEEVSKPCPGCTVRIQKNDGCDHMTCRRCKHEFCWICFADYSGPNGVFLRGNDAHLDSCKYAARRLPNYRGPRL